ncbi:MAG: NTP transferase domain-containing protein [Proteobacteria bacterium]|nr:NTP transferase domain-containing protein [Pseudomonadota bacterium]
MRAIVLSAEQGKRLLPLTSETPRCLLPVRASRTLLEAQLRALVACGVTEVSVMAGFRADRVGALLDADPVPGLRAMAFYNPFFNIAGNLATCWVARSEMREDFVLVNGDTLFEAAVLERLLDSPPALVTLAVNEKSQYDPDAT